MHHLHVYTVLCWQYLPLHQQLVAISGTACTASECFSINDDIPLKNPIFLNSLYNVYLSWIFVISAFSYWRSTSVYILILIFPGIVLIGNII